MHAGIASTFDAKQRIIFTLGSSKIPNVKITLNGQPYTPVWKKEVETKGKIASATTTITVPSQM